MFIIRSKEPPFLYFLEPWEGVTSEISKAHRYTEAGAKDILLGVTSYIAIQENLCAQSMDATPERLHAEGPAPQHSVQHPLCEAEYVKAKGWDTSGYVSLTPISKILPTDPKERKDAPIATGLLDYFPDACWDVARLSKGSNDKHNPGEPMHWSRGKSNDHRDTMVRHTLQSREIDEDATGRYLHATKAAWRALAEAQLAIEELRAKGIKYP